VCINYILYKYIYTCVDIDTKVHTYIDTEQFSAYLLTLNCLLFTIIEPQIVS
jgi:hypothetical protein